MSERGVLFHGGRVHVGDGRSVEALLAQGGRVAALGSAKDLRRDAGDAGRIDLRGGLMVPGWCDTHVHFMWWGIQMAEVDLRETASLREALATVADRARMLRPGRWLTGGRFDKNRWGDWPTASDLDTVTGDRPAVLRSRDGHSRWLNGAALRAAGIGRGTEPPAGGAILRDASGTPTGILQERANELVDTVVPPPSDDDCYEAILRAQREAFARGVTGMEDLESSVALQALQRMHGVGELALRVDIGIPHRSIDSARRILAPWAAMPLSNWDLESALAAGVRTGAGDEWLRIGHLKLFSDGALGSQTAALEEPYEGTDDRGILTLEPDAMKRDVARAANAGIATAIHAIGDRAVHHALDALEPTRRTHPELRQRIEHIQLVRTEDLGRFGALGIIASMQPIHCTSDRDLADRYWGAARVERAYPWRTLLASGAVLAFGSDAPVEPIDPLLGIHAAVTRRRPSDTDPWHPEQRLRLEEALAAYSAGAAYARSREDGWGTLEVGKHFDATVVDRDLATLREDEILEATVRATITAGVVRFENELG